jgi:hypothetical protein
LTSIFFDYGGANQVELTEGVVTAILMSRNTFRYNLAGDNSVWENGGKADREWLVEMGGPISVDDLAKLKTLVDSTAQVHFRAAVTGNVDVHVLITSLKTPLSCDGLPSAASTTRAMHITATLREAV